METFPSYLRSLYAGDHECLLIGMKISFYSHIEHIVHNAKQLND